MLSFSTRIRVVLSFAFAVLVFASPNLVSAQSTIDAPVCEGTIWVCPSMKTVAVDRGGNHTLQLTASNLPTVDPANNLPIQWYAVCGYDDPVKGQLFTSGASSADKLMCLGETTLDDMSKPFISSFGRSLPRWEMTFLSGSNPLTTSNGNLDVTIKIISADVRNVSCFFAAKTTPNVVGRGDQNVSIGSEDTDSLVYATFRSEGVPAACLSVRNDPFGRVFNASTLKPVPGAAVSIYDHASKASLKVPGVRNPVVTREDGVFNFNIEPSTTYLTTNLTNFDITKVHPNAAFAYTNLYTYGDPIVEAAGAQEQRDIPVTGGLSPVLKLMGFSHLQLGTQTRIEGRASWPLTLVEVMQGTTAIAQKQADKFGGFSFFIDNGSIDPGQQIMLKLTEVDLLAQTPSPLIGGKNVQRIFDPIPRYIEGYAYDKAGKLMPFATARVVIDNSEVVYYETKANGEAFYSIGPKFLPILPYHLEYSPANVIPAPGNTTKITIPEFVKSNKEYHDVNVIDLMRGRKNGVDVDPHAYVENNGKKSANAGLQDGQNGDQNSGQYNKTGGRSGSPLDSLALATGQSNTTLLIVLIILFVLVSAVLVMYVRRQRDEEPERPDSSLDDDDEPEIMV